ncbi:MAG: putative heme-binding domain-containing protein [Verrucomicrobiales bacterium]|jgi:putative heme-binding domain-containing protein
MMRFFAIFLILSGATAQERQATPPEQLLVPDGFKIELLRSAGDDEGSWISMTFDDQDRVIVALDKQGLARISIDPEKPGFEKIDDTLQHCRGVLFAHGALYANATNSQGFYRLRNTTGDENFDEVSLLKKFDYRSRYGHGQNQMKLGPDGMIYLVIGNDCAFPEGVSPNSPYRNPQPDQLLPNPHDAGHDNRVGYIVRTDKDGQTWEVIAGGLRNQVDIAFNPVGEMFTWDADMEWDIGLPWYRPTRVNHIVSGGEYGWRWGSGKWPDWRADALPSNLDTGMASPTGIDFGTQSHFPVDYKQALFLADWQNGRILAANPTPVGASYEFEYKVFIEGAPLNVADFVFGEDGAMYFITGGRGSQSGLYRVSHKKPMLGPIVAKPEDQRTWNARKIRLDLERFHTLREPAGVELAFQHLDSDDPWIRFAARLALERQDPSLWRKRALNSNSITALMAMARTGKPSDLKLLLKPFQNGLLENLDRQQLLSALRTLQLAFERLGRPEGPTSVSTLLLKRYADRKTKSGAVRRELLELLVFLESPAVLDIALFRLAAEPTQEGQIQLVQSLVYVESGWKREHHRKILEWFVRAKRFRGGRLLKTTMKNLRADHLAKLNEVERSALRDLVDKVEDDTPEPMVFEAPGSFVKEWALADFEGDDLVLGNGHPGPGRRAAAASMCLVCHRVGEEGGQIGPDLTNVGGRFDSRTLLESMIEPSAVISPKYRSIRYGLEDGSVVHGQAVGVSGSKLRIETNPLTREVVEIERGTILSTAPSEISPMPAGLINTLTREQILDLLAYLKGPE